MGLTDVDDQRSRTQRSTDQKQSSGYEQLLREVRVHQAELENQNEELREAQAALEASHGRFVDLYDHAPVGYFTISPDGFILQANLTAANLLEIPRSELISRRFASHVALDDRDQWYRLVLRACREPVRHECDLTLARADGTQFFARLDCQQHIEGNHAAIRVTVTDLTQRRKAETGLRLAASVFTHAREAIMITDNAGCILDVNAAFSAITGFSAAEVIGKTPRVLSSGLTDRAFYAGMWRKLSETQFWQGEIWNRRRNGDAFVAGQTITAVLNAKGEVQHYVSLFNDVTEVKEHQRQLEYTAHYDPLTHLPNRVLLAERMQQAMAMALPMNMKVAIAYLDLDGFKAVNDAYGHEAGDRVLTAVARRMRQTLREGCTLSRLGGDEFVVVMVGLKEFCDMLPMLDRLLEAACEPIQTPDFCAQVSASIGVSYFPQETDVSADQLLRQADQAMYQAKLEGKNRYHVFDAQQDLDLRGHNAKLDRLDRALREDEFVLYYQPKVNMRTGEVVGSEALIRWQHPDNGLVAPEFFLPLVNDNALCEMIGDWVIEHALRQIEAWQQQGVSLPVSINVGARQLQQPDFITRLIARLAEHPAVPAGMLMIEILETSALEDMDGVSRTIKACSALGVRFALDDFGTGYSSLTYLKRLPVAQLKIDQTFVQGMLDDPDDLSILQSIMSLATAFKKEVIAEGVDSIAVGNRLLQLGCELAQGYVIAEPMPGAAMLAWLSRWRPDPAWLEPAPA